MMKSSLITRLFAILCMIIIGGANSWADDEVTVNKPTILDGTDDSNGNYTFTFDGNITATINADEGCTIIYKWGSTASTSAQLQTSTSATHIDNNVATTKKNYTSNRVLSAIAAKVVDGTTYYSDVTTATYTYVADNKKTLTLSAEDFKIKVNSTQQIRVTAKDGDTEVSGLTYTYTSSNEAVATVDNTGLVTGNMSGNASITISFAGNNDYKEASISINVGITSNANTTADGTTFTNIADVRQAGQSTLSLSSKPYWILNFSEENPATVVGVFTKDDPDMSEGTGHIFIMDKTGRGLMVPDGNKLLNHTLAIGDKITGQIVFQYKQRKSMIPEAAIVSSREINEQTYTTKIAVDETGRGSVNGTKDAVYPTNEIADVNTLANNNPKEGSIVESSYGIYLNSIVSVPGIIRLGAGNTYYLVQNANSGYDENNDDKRLVINTTQIGVDIADYVNTEGVFEGILIKRGKQYAKLVVLKNNFFSINKIYLDENDPETRIDDLVSAGAFTDEVEVYVHRTKLTNEKAWNTLCFPFDLTGEEFNTAFGCNITALAKPKVKSEETINDRLTKIGDVDNNGNLLFETQTSLNIEEGMPYLMKASGTQTKCNKTINYKKDDGTDKTPQELMTEDPDYYAYIGQKYITVVPPHQIKGYYNNDIVKGDFYFRGLYGRKSTAENGTDDLYDNGSQKYQYISTAEGNYLKYLGESNKGLKFPGMRAYFYFPNWDKTKNNPNAGSNSTVNSKIHIFVDDSAITGISNVNTNTEDKTARIYNLAGQVVDSSYKGIVIKNGRKYIAK